MYLCLRPFICYLYYLLMCPSISLSPTSLPPCLPTYLCVHPAIPCYGSLPLAMAADAAGLQGVTGQVTGQVDPGHWRQCGALPFMEGSPLSQKVFVSRGDGLRAGSRCHVRVCALSRPGSRRPRGWTSVAEHSHLLESWLPASTHGSQGAAGGEGATIQPVKAAHGFSPLGPFFCSIFTNSLLPCANLVPTGA